MKRVIKSSTQNIKASSPFGTHRIVKNWHGTDHNYSVTLYNEDNLEKLSMQIFRLHPYDDAEYAFARVESFSPDIAQIIKNGEFLSSVTFVYDDNSYSVDSVREYINEFIDKIISELEQVNQDVEPKMLKF